MAFPSTEIKQASIGSVEQKTGLEDLAIGLLVPSWVSLSRSNSGPNPEPSLKTIVRITIRTRQNSTAMVLMLNFSGPPIA